MIGALWVNVHGSWPLVVVYLLVRAVGGLLDREPVDRELERAALDGVGDRRSAGS
ncbi:MAG: hypothetical protein R2695_20295 [Acidimicrobiales bacterium]